MHTCQMLEFDCLAVLSGRPFGETLRKRAKLPSRVVAHKESAVGLVMEIKNWDVGSGVYFSHFPDE
jgi:hypothetical protein